LIGHITDLSTNRDTCTPSLAPLQCLRGELVVAGVFVRLYAEQPGFQLSDPPAFCKALVTYIYQEQQAGDEKAEQQQQQGQQGQAGSEAAAAAQRREHLLQALRALRSVLEGAPRLLGLLATRTAVDPLLQCLRPAVEAGLPGGAAWTDAAAADPASAAAELAAAPPVWAAPGAAPAGVGAGVGVNGVGAAELEGAELALTVLLRLTAHAGCLEALGQDKCVAQALWLAHRAPSAAAMLLALRLLTALAGTAAAAWGAAAHGGALFLLTLLLPAYPGKLRLCCTAASRAFALAAMGLGCMPAGAVPTALLLSLHLHASPAPPSSAAVPDEQRESFEAARVAAAALLSRLSAHALHGARVSLILAKILPPGLVSAIQDGPGEAAVAALGQASETPERVWSRGMQRAAAEEAAHAAAAARAAQAGGGALEWQLPDGFRMRYRELEGELMVGGVYVRLYLKDPRYPLRWEAVHLLKTAGRPALEPVHG
jgi:DnaJ family protein C protein 13